MNKKDRFILYNNNDEFEYRKNTSYIHIKFNRVAFIFFVFFIISIVYSIHLTHLGSRKSEDLDKNQIKTLNKLKRADIVDRDGNFLAKTVSSIDIGINPVEIIDHKKLLLNLGYIFPNKDYEHIGFGTVNDTNGNPLKTRDGGNLKLSDLYDQTFTHIEKINQSLSSEDINCLTNTVLTFSDLITNRKTDYKFDLDMFTNVSGKTGIYVQYAQVRANRLIETIQQEKNNKDSRDIVPLSELERNLIIQLANIEFFIDLSLRNSEPHHLANYLYEISSFFNAFYQDSNIKNMKNSIEKDQKILIINLFIQYSHLVMKCLGIKPVEKM